MANIHSRGRRPALIPDSVLLSPEEAEDVLRRRAGSISPHGSTDSQPPRLENPFKPSQIAPSEETYNESQVNGEHFLRNKSCYQGGDPVWLTDSFHGKRSLQVASRSANRDKFRKLNGQGTLHYPLQLRLESRSVDSPYAENERRRYSMDMSQNIPHMSEIPPETRVRCSGFILPNSQDNYSVGPTVCAPQYMWYFLLLTYLQLETDNAWKLTY